jgi:hypothetical protein
MKKEYSSIRCPNERPHSKYDVCGHLLGAVRDGIVYVYCDECKIFYKIEAKDNDTIEMSPLPRNVKLDLKTTMRALA